MKKLTSSAVTATQLKVLLNSARKAAKKSYSPYSGFKVGAALQLSNGEIVAGTNVESISYGLTICAERSALVSAVSRFGPKVRVRAVAVANLNGGASPPCGACRQLLREYAPDAKVFVADSNDLKKVKKFTVRGLLPAAFVLVS